MDNQIALTELARVDITTVNKADLFDVSGITFDNDISSDKRAAHILKMLKNPYCFRYGDIGVKLEFADNARSLQDVLGDLLERKKGGHYGAEKPYQ